MIGDAEQYQELVTLYASYGEEELVALGRGMGDLTQTAQQALKGELTRRGLRIAPAGETDNARVLTVEDLQDMRSFAQSARRSASLTFRRSDLLRLPTTR